MNHFAAGLAMREYIAEKMPELRQTRLAASLAEIADWQPSSPAVWIVWDGDYMADTGGRGHAQIIRQRWVVALIVRSMRDAAAGGGTVEEAGAILHRLIGLLMGWQPPAPSGCRPLVRVQAPAPGYGAGYGFFPAAFETAIPMTGD